jgi:hypothetical protein
MYFASKVGTKVSKQLATQILVQNYLNIFKIQILIVILKNIFEICQKTGSEALVDKLKNFKFDINEHKIVQILLLAIENEIHRLISSILTFVKYYSGLKVAVFNFFDRLSITKN